MRLLPTALGAVIGLALLGHPPPARAIDPAPTPFWAAHDDIVGLYRTSGSRPIAIGMYPSAEIAYVAWLDSGEVRFLEADGADAFVFGPTRSRTSPAQGRLRVVRGQGGDAAALEITVDSDTTLANRADAARRAVSFENGAAAQLSGELWTPAGTGPFPGAVIVTQSDRFDNFEAGMALMDAGVAVLFYDQRDADPGASSGEAVSGWLHETQRVYAGDAAAAYDFLRDQPEIAPDRVSLVGWSGGGYMSAMVAAERPDAAFIVSIAGNVSPWLEQARWRFYARLFREGFSEEEIAAADAFLAIHFALARGEAAWSEYAAARDAVAETAWYGFLTSTFTMTYDDEADALRWGAAMEAAPPFGDFARVATPALGVFFEHDHSSPPTTPLLFHRAMVEAGNDDFGVIVIPDANHGAWEVDGLGFDTQAIRRRNPRTFAVMAAWVAARTRAE